uniref:Tail protein n=1 Tax=viral metagenome TaxID=1070528 RepID=A0A6M3XEV7_9ZZZZ
MTASKQFKSFAIHKAYVAAYSASVAATWTEFPIVADGTLTLTVQEADVRDGEGSLDYTWYHTQDGMVTLRGKEASLRVLEMITGNDAVTSMAGKEKMYFGTDEELTPPLLRLKMVAKAVDEDDTEGYIIVIAYKARGRFPTINMSETTPGEISIEFRLLKSTVDDQAITVTSCLGHLEAVPAAFE